MMAEAVVYRHDYYYYYYYYYYHDQCDRDTCLAARLAHPIGVSISIYIRMLILMKEQW